jgi:hypothetical protein
MHGGLLGMGFGTAVYCAVALAAMTGKALMRFRRPR